MHARLSSFEVEFLYVEEKVEIVLARFMEENYYFFVGGGREKWEKWRVRLNSAQFQLK